MPTGRIKNKNIKTIPCSTGIIGPNAHKYRHAKGSLSAIFLSDSVWQPGSSGKITVTFGSNACSGCSGCASWSEVGTNSTGITPSMNLGYIDPPFGTSFLAVDGNTYQIPSFSSGNCACGSSDCDCTCGGGGLEDKNPTRNYCSTDSTGIEDCISSSKAGGVYTGAFWTPGGTVIHEFGHALGMLHEHENDLNGALSLVPNSINSQGTLNVQEVEDYYTQLMGNSTEGVQDAVTNVLTFYSNPSKYEGSTYDPYSIMLYYLPNSWINGCASYTGSDQICQYNPTQANFTLSVVDKEWLQKMYPQSLPLQEWPVLTVQFIDPEAEPWKMAWVMTVVTNNYGPLVGVTWNWLDPMGQVLKVVGQNSTGLGLGTLPPIVGLGGIEAYLNNVVPGTILMGWQLIIIVIFSLILFIGILVYAHHKKVF